MINRTVVATIGALVLAGAVFGYAPAAALAATADLSVDKADSPDPVEVGSQLTYSITVSNAGPATANNVQLDDVLPNRVDFVSAMSPQGPCSQQARKVGCRLGALASGADATVSILVTPNKAGQIVNTATVSTNDTDPVAANNSDSETTTVIEPPPPAQCAGKAASIVGTEGSDMLVGTNGKDVIVALGGNDTIDGLGGNDLVCGLGGNDVIRVRGGHDRVRAGGGDDRLRGGDGPDGLRGGSGRDRLDGGRGGDSLDGGTGHDKCFGGPGSDHKHSC